MPANRSTTNDTEADLEARIRAAIKKAFPGLPDGSIKHQIKFTFKFGKQTIEVDAGKQRAEARLDILLEKDGRPLAVMELKRPGLALADEDDAQGVSYARLVQPPAPLVVVTNGSDVRILETSTGSEWNAGSASEEAFLNLIKRACRVANDEITTAIETLMGTASHVWIQAVRRISAATIDELTAVGDESGLPFAEGFLLPRRATHQILKNLDKGTKLQVLEGPPLAGKSSVLRELSLRATQQDNIGVLYVETETGVGALQLLADVLRQIIHWPVSTAEARDWLIRVSLSQGSKLVLAFDGLSASDSLTLREIVDLTSGAFGPALSIVVAMDEGTAQRVLRAGNEQSLSVLGRRAKRVILGRLDDQEFDYARRVLGQRRFEFIEGADMAPEYREPWVLRAIYDARQVALERLPKEVGFGIPPLLGLELFDLVRTRFADKPDLRRSFRGLACAMIADAQDPSRPPDIVLQQQEIGLIRREAVTTVVEAEDLSWLFTHGYVRAGMHDIVGATILVRMPELLASELAHAFADEIARRLPDEPDATAAWISGGASNLPLGEIIAAQAIVDVANRTGNFPLDLLDALLQLQPEREVIDVGSHLATLAPDHSPIDIRLEPEGTGILVNNGIEHLVDLNDEKLIAYSNYHAWLVLSHVASRPFEVITAEGALRGDPSLLLEIGACSIPLRGNRGPGSMRAYPTIDFDNGVSIVRPEAGLIEPISLAMLEYLSSNGPDADYWVAIAADSGSVALIARLRIALEILASFEPHGQSAWAKAQLETLVYPKLQEAMAHSAS